MISLGNIQRLGGWYGIHPSNNHLLIIKDSTHGSIIGQAYLSSNNLLPSNLLTATTLPTTSLLSTTSLNLADNNSTPTFSSAVSTAPFILPLPTDPSHSPITSVIHAPATPSLPLTFSSLPLAQFNKEQQTRAALAYNLHQFNHNSNAINGTACECGVLPLQLTRADFQNMTAIYGQCGSCVAGKNSTVNHGPVSHSPPPTSASEFLHADLITLDNGVTVLLSKDDHSGYVLPAKLLLGKTKSSLSDCRDVTRRHYNALGWKILHINTDSEEAFKSSQGPLQDRGILCTVTPPDKHEKSLERTWQTIKKKWLSSQIP